MEEKILVYVLIVMLVCFYVSETYKCQSCYYGCPDMLSCECVNSNKTCDGNYCFVKIKKVDPDDDVSVIFKGCVDKVIDDWVGGCQYAGDKNSVECYCKGDMCNVASGLNLYQPKPLPEIRCCQCDPFNEEEDVGCNPTECIRSCMGNYCYVNSAQQTQGCGFGYPKQISMLRTKSLATWENEQYSCSLSVAGDHPNSVSWKRECNCFQDNCNMILPSYEHDHNLTERSTARQMYCHNFVDDSERPITMDSYNKSTWCEGHYCYVTVQTNVITETFNNINKLRLQYEIFAGCIMADNDTKVSVGCTTEWSAVDAKTPFRKHCICSNDYCNFFNLINDEPRSKYLIFAPSSTVRRELSIILFSLCSSLYLILH